MRLPEAVGPIGGMRNLAAELAGDSSALRFMCRRCVRVRRTTKLILYSLLVGMIALILILERLGVL